jgi:hypothetical protein
MQFGRALLRILQKNANSDPRLGPVYLSKIDIADGFYRIAIRSNDVPKLAIMIPTAKCEEPLVGLHLVLPMGWKQSPPLFTVATETVANLANTKLPDMKPSVPHRLELLSETPIRVDPPPMVSAQGPASLPLPPTRRRRWQAKPRPVKSWDVYVDDFIGMVQGNRNHRTHVKRILLSSLDEVMRRLDDADDVHRQEPTSVKKMPKGDGSWATRKIVLGWMIDTCAMTIQLPAHCVLRLLELVDSISPTQRRTTVKKWQQLLGELQSMVLTIPGGRGLFSVLQQVLKAKCDQGTRICLSREVHHVLADFRWLDVDLTARPKRMDEVIPKATPDTLGAQDAAAFGMGDVHFVPQMDGSVQTILWRSPFPAEIQRRLISHDNPDGDINNSELELAASVAQHDILAQQFDVREATIHNSSDSIATVC